MHTWKGSELFLLWKIFKTHSIMPNKILCMIITWISNNFLIWSSFYNWWDDPQEIWQPYCSLSHKVVNFNYFINALKFLSCLCHKTCTRLKHRSQFLSGIYCLHSEYRIELEWYSISVWQLSSHVCMMWAKIYIFCISSSFKAIGFLSILLPKSLWK